MNYFTDEATLGDALRSLKVGLTSYFHEKQLYKGTAVGITLQHFSKVLSVLKGDPK